MRDNRTSLAVQWLRLCASTVGGMGSIPSWGTKIPHATRGQKKKTGRDGDGGGDGDVGGRSHRVRTWIEF